MDVRVSDGKCGALVWDVSVSDGKPDGESVMFVCPMASLGP